MDLTWPVVVLILGLVVIGVFKSDLSSLLRRTKKLTVQGIETSDERLPEAHPTVEVKSGGPLDAFLKGTETPLVVENEQWIRKELDQRGFKTVEEREKALLRGASVGILLFRFEQVHGQILASQWQAIHGINVKPTGMTVAELMPFYDAGKARAPELFEKYPFDQWLNYLESATLVIERDGRKVITNFGREYLKHLISNGRGGPLRG